MPGSRLCPLSSRFSSAGGPVLAEEPQDAGTGWGGVVHLEGHRLLLPQEGHHDDPAAHLPAPPLPMKGPGVLLSSRQGGGSAVGQPHGGRPAPREVGFAAPLACRGNKARSSRQREEGLLPPTLDPAWADRGAVGILPKHALSKGPRGAFRETEVRVPWLIVAVLPGAVSWPE